MKIFLSVLVLIGLTGCKPESYPSESAPGKVSCGSFSGFQEVNIKGPVRHGSGLVKFYSVDTDETVTLLPLGYSSITCAVTRKGNFNN